MLNVESKKFNPFQPKKKEKKAAILTTVAKQNRPVFDFFAT